MALKTRIGLDETNLVNFGSELEKANRKEAELEEEWNFEGTPIGQQVGTYIWRIQNFGLLRVPEKQHGQFYTGDSYIVLKTTNKPNSDALVHHLHFWLGQETTQDEAGTAAYKTVKLDDFLDGAAVQHREVQTRESALFKGYFSSLTYLQGGFESGFHHVEEEDLPTRLLRVLRPVALEHSRTHNAVVISQVPLSYESLSSQAVFVLDTGNVVYQWQGMHAKGIERAKAAEFIVQLLSERGGKGEMVIQASVEETRFFEALGSEGPIHDGDQEHKEQEEQEKDKEQGTKKLMCLSSSGLLGLGHLRFDVVAEGTITREMFDSQHVYIFDVGHQVYAWIGREAGRRERKYGLHYAQDYVKQSGKSPFTPLCRMMEGAEDELFESSLEGWQGW
ncbi:hypothetical protein BDF14DRAFT_1725211 [Spinellus fusiger]|nr:hypothetical protein BDF14DRAFT_1725211 [Spinellus fusiger]